MEVSVPSHYVVRQLLRDQKRRKDAYRSWFDRAYEDSWKSRQPMPKPSAAKLITFAKNFVAQFEEANAFNRRDTGSIERLRLKAEAGFSTDAHVLWPVTFGLNRLNPDPVYAEQALMLVRTGAKITRNKVSVYEAPLCFCWTKHALERICERTSIGNNLLPVLTALSSESIRRLALLLGHGLQKRTVDPLNPGITAWMPFLDGMAVFTHRLVAAPNYALDVGWKFSFTRQRFSQTYLKKDLLLPRTADSCRGDNQLVAAVWFMTTFVGRHQLSSDQLKYISAVNRLIKAAPPALVQEAYEAWFDPDTINQPGDEEVVYPDGEAGIALAAAVDALGRPFFKALARDPVVYLLADGTTSTALREMS
ncbi:hypothetical protein [Sphingomonas desiccabilis]|uniref:Uncharacterized protein n=1 Tax=Sphingomonas desiccabilis TaxID=429134 RepID=A0A4V1QPN5_9SPHN|nr:hypothetical protein [Sphingomonas desiccabilis]MBB3909724.1 hypothetical protein [Sphingomonas desiccabilis]RXZ34417.1 hypothetical protein EO081_01625 [Sphingomonas desiccabilis]